MISIFPTAYFGNVAYFKQLVKAEQPVIELHEHFVKQTIRTRCSILSANGPIQLAVPVVKMDGSKTILQNIKICSETKWQLNHWRAIQSAYASAPFFDYYGPEVHDLIFANDIELFALNQNITRTILNWLDIELPISFSTEFKPFNQEYDFRNYDFELIELSIKPYKQVFASKDQFNTNMSMLDLIMNEGPLARKWILSN